HSLGDRLGVTKVVLLALGIRPNIFRRHQPGVMAKAVQLAAEMMRADASFHADQARRHIGKSSFNLATRPFLPQDNRAALVEADHMERALADIDANDGDLIGCRVGHGRAPFECSPNPALLASGAGTRPDHPISGPWLSRERCSNTHSADPLPAGAAIGFALTLIATSGKSEPCKRA